MAIIPLKAWYLEQYEPIKNVVKQPCHLRLSRNSLLKSGLRADFLDDRLSIETSDWFARYLEGETIEFYIEGSGNYVIANIDLVSQEIYFSKQEAFSGLEPIIYYSPQTEDSDRNQKTIAVLAATIDKLNQRSRLPLTLELAPRPQDSPLRLSNNQFRKIRKSLLFIAEATPIASILGEKNQSHLLLSPLVCVEIGYALESKDKGYILILQKECRDLTGKFPFDVSGYKQLSYKTPEDLKKTLPKVIESLLKKYNLFG